MLLLDFAVQIMDLDCNRGSRLVSFKLVLRIVEKKLGRGGYFSPVQSLALSMVHLIVNCSHLAAAEDHYLLTCSLVLAIEEQLFLPAVSRTARENGVGYLVDQAPQREKALLQISLREGSGGGKPGKGCARGSTQITHN